jgi:pimeloyl-ACP methyl ester carboxylesterase
MATFLLLHGAASTGWLWHRVSPLLEAEGHRCLAPDLPCEDPSADLEAYLRATCAAVADRPDEPVIVVAQSMAGLFAPLVPTLRSVAGIVLLAAMIPRPGETGAQWWQATGQAAAQRRYLHELGLDPSNSFDPETVFLHDFSDTLKAESAAHVRDQQSLVMAQPSPLRRWPEIRTMVIAAAQDRLFPLPFMQAQARDRLGVDAVVIPGGHLAALTHPVDLTHELRTFAAGSSGVLA